MANLLDLKCNVCIEFYSDKAKPRNLDCGHSVCSSCLDMIIPVGKSCPECRQSFNAKSAHDLAINHPVLRLSRLHTLAGLDKESQAPKLALLRKASAQVKGSATCSLHGHLLSFRCVRCDVFICRNCTTSDHQDQPYGRCVIISIQDFMNNFRDSYLIKLTKCLKDAHRIRKELALFDKGSRYAVNYWEKRLAKGEIQECHKNLQDARDFNEELKKEIAVVQKWLKVSDKLKDAKHWEDLAPLAEVAESCISEVEKYKTNVSVPEFKALIEPFWKGPQTFSILGNKE